MTKKILKEALGVFKNEYGCYCDYESRLESTFPVGIDSINYEDPNIPPNVKR